LPMVLLILSAELNHANKSVNRSARPLDFFASDQE